MRDVLAHDSRRVRLLAVLGIAAAFVLARTETSQAAYSLSSSALAGEVVAQGKSGARQCLSGSDAGPCFFLAVTVKGPGTVTTPVADAAGLRITCPSRCSTAPDWFIWGFDYENPYIELAPGGSGTFTGWQTESGDDPCHAAQGSDPPVPVNRCRLYANSIGGDGSWCVIATFNHSTTTTAGDCVEPSPAPVGEPVTVEKIGTGSGRVYSTTLESVPKQLDCGSVCSAVFPQGTTITLRREPAQGSRFVGWSGTNVPSQCLTTAFNCEFMLGPNTVSVKARFETDTPTFDILNAVILQKPAKTTRKRTARFVWGAKRAGAFVNPFKSQCRLNKQVWKACSPPKTYRNLKAGRSHTFRVRVKDAKRNEWDKTPAVWTWRIRR